LVDATTANRGEDLHHEEGDEQADGGGSEDQAYASGGWRCAEKENTYPIDGEAEADDGEVSMTAGDLASHIGDAILELTARRKVVEKS
jgi:hypothetical protein